MTPSFLVVDQLVVAVQLAPNTCRHWRPEIYSIPFEQRRPVATMPATPLAGRDISHTGKRE